ncbi:MAG: gliding motility protein GldL [Bacteroidaceae bacterium]|nr:gliding motility protein GldL [Bacteroidaceae bacterium]
MSKFSLIARLQHWMDSVPGQTFMNYAYSWGAAVVILGTLFKLTHIPGANAMLFIGMGTEVFVFFISGFDRPFDSKTDTQLADEFIDLEDMEAVKEAAQAAAAAAGSIASSGIGASSVPGSAEHSSTVISGGGGGGTVIIGGGASGAPSGTVVVGGGTPASGDVSGSEGPVVIGGGAGISDDAAANLAAAAAAVAQIGNNVGGNDPQSAMDSAKVIGTPEVEDAITAYVEQLTELTEVLNRVKEQADRMTQDSLEMENLNRTLTGINTIYEMQLKSISQQVGTIDNINEQTRRMAQQIEELNSIYARMIEAMTVNMPGAAPKV